MRKKGVVAGLLRKVIAAAIGMLARIGIDSSAAPTICSPGIIRKMPMNRPANTPRGTDRRVKRHSSERADALAERPQPAAFEHLVLASARGGP